MNAKRGVRWAAVLVPAIFAMLAVSHPQANSLLEGLKREAESAIRRKANELTQKEVVECPAGDEKCAVVVGDHQHRTRRRRGHSSTRELAMACVPAGGGR